MFEQFVSKFYLFFALANFASLVSFANRDHVNLDIDSFDASTNFKQLSSADPIPIFQFGFKKTFLRSVLKQSNSISENH